MDDCGEDPEATCCLMFLILLLLPLLWRFFNLGYIFSLTFFRITGFFKSFFVKPGDLTAPGKMSGLWHSPNLDEASMLATITRECSTARNKLLHDNGVWSALNKAGATMTSGGQAVRLTGNLGFLDRYTIDSKVVSWDDDSLYVEQEVKRGSDGPPVAVVVARERLRGITPKDLTVASCGCSITSPNLPAQLDCWLQCPDVNKADVNPYCFLKQRMALPHERAHTHTHRIHIHLHQVTPADSHSRCTNIQIDAATASQFSHMHCTHIEIPACPMEESVKEMDPEMQALSQVHLQEEIQAQKMADMQAQMQTEMQTQMQADTQARMQADTQARMQADTQARMQADTQARMQADMQARMQADMQARMQADTQVPKQAKKNTGKKKLD